ncbi:MAG: hypothetical protein JNL98_12785 [Bryobacterales bacterium]|nr:hypothetical protein [Bryobacterales bacterium]
MATLVATLVDRLVGRGVFEATAAEAYAERRSQKAVDYRLRAFPNDDVHFFVKAIDNTSVIREADPRVPSACWKTIAGATTGAVLLIGLLLPSGYRMMAGYQIEELRKQKDQLLLQKASLEIEEARLVSPERLAELAADQHLIDPAPNSVVHLEQKSAMAMHQRAESAEKQ